MCLVLMLVMMSGGYTVYLFEEVAKGGFEWALIGLAALGGMGWLMFRGPVGKALASMLEGQSHSDADNAQLIDDLHHRIAQLEQRGLTSGEVEQAFGRIADVESRLDFTERLLTQVGERARNQLPGGEGT
jgi:hypothetical protein